LYVSVGGQDGIPGFVEFIYDSILPACFRAPLESSFDLSDGQTTLVSSKFKVLHLYMTFLFTLY